MDEITTRLAGPGDDKAIAAMVDAMDRYYRDAERPDGETRAAVTRWLQREMSDTRFVLAFTGDVPVGMAAFAIVHPGNALSGLLFLKDLFVEKAWRNRQVGELIMAFLARFCIDHRIGRIDWTTESDQAQRFYERLGAETRPLKRPMRLEGKALADLAGK